MSLAVCALAACATTQAAPADVCSCPTVVKGLLRIVGNPGLNDEVVGNAALCLSEATKELQQMQDLAPVPPLIGGYRPMRMKSPSATLLVFPFCHVNFPNSHVSSLLIVPWG